MQKKEAQNKVSNTLTESPLPPPPPLDEKREQKRARKLLKETRREERREEKNNPSHLAQVEVLVKNRSRSLKAKKAWREREQEEMSFDERVHKQHNISSAAHVLGGKNEKYDYWDKTLDKGKVKKVKAKPEDNNEVKGTRNKFDKAHAKKKRKSTHEDKKRHRGDGGGDKYKSGGDKKKSWGDKMKPGRDNKNKFKSGDKKKFRKSF